MVATIDIILKTLLIDRASSQTSIFLYLFETCWPKHFYLIFKHTSPVKYFNRANAEKYVLVNAIGSHLTLTSQQKTMLFSANRPLRPVCWGFNIFQSQVWVKLRSFSKLLNVPRFLNSKLEVFTCVSSRAVQNWMVTKS